MENIDQPDGWMGRCRDCHLWYPHAPVITCSCGYIGPSVMKARVFTVEEEDTVIKEETLSLDAPKRVFHTWGLDE
jgi:hypothetical protein